MNQKEDKDLLQKTRRKRRSVSKKKIEAGSLEVVLTPVDTVPTQKKKSNPKDTIQERAFVTATTASTSKRKCNIDYKAV